MTIYGHINTTALLVLASDWPEDVVRGRLFIYLLNKENVI